MEMLIAVGALALRSCFRLDIFMLLMTRGFSFVEGTTPCLIGRAVTRQSVTRGLQHSLFFFSPTNNWSLSPGRRSAFSGGLSGEFVRSFSDRWPLSDSEFCRKLFPRTCHDPPEYDKARGIARSTPWHPVGGLLCFPRERGFRHVTITHSEKQVHCRTRIFWRNTYFSTLCK